MPSKASLFLRVKGGPRGEELGVSGGVLGSAVADVGEVQDGVGAGVAEDIKGGS